MNKTQIKTIRDKGAKALFSDNSSNSNPFDNSFISLRPNRCFTPEKKQLFLQLFGNEIFVNNKYDYFKTGVDVMKKIGMSKTSFYYHYVGDRNFNLAIEPFKKAIAYKLEGKMMEYGQLRTQFMDRIAIQRAYIPEKYGRNNNLQVNINANDVKFGIKS